MAKTTAPAASPGTKKQKAKGKVVHQQNAHKARREALKKLGWLTVFLLLVTAASVWGSLDASPMSLAVLYILPDGAALSGRAGSVVHQRNGVRRNYVTPALVQNDATQTVRGSFSTNTSGFRDLTPSQIEAWNAAAPNFTYVDRFGRTKPFPSGIALYNSLNRNLFTVGATAITDPPVPAGVPGITAITVTGDESASSLDVAYTPTPTDGDVDHAVFATAQLSPGRSRPRKSDFRQIGIISAGSASPATFGTVYEDRFGSLTAGSKVFVKISPINIVTGQAGASIVGSCIVVA